ncbi:MAG: RNA polymerase sigma factor [Verrucomicrobiales bacterium]
MQSPPPASAPDSSTASLSLQDVFASEESPLLRYAMSMCRCFATAEEAVQEAFLRLHKHWATVERPRPWLYRCVRNLILNELRGKKRETELPEDETVSTDLGAPDTLARWEACGLLRELIGELSRRDQEVVLLKYQHGLGYAEISQRTGLSVSNVGYRLHHILKSLGEGLRAHGVNSARG